MAFLVQGGAPPDDSVTTAKIKDDAVTAAKVAAGVLPGKNLLINSDFRIAQRGTSFAAAAHLAYTLDRWIWFDNGAGVVTITQDTDTPTVAEAGTDFKFSLKIDVTTADASLAASDRYVLSQKLEGFNSAHLGFGASSANSVTVSFWVKSPKTGAHYIGLGNNAGNRSHPATYSVSSADTWEKKSVTIAGDTTGTWIGATNSIGLYLFITLATGTDYQGTAGSWGTTANGANASGGVNCMDDAANNFLITGVQLEVGSAASDFEHRDYASELVRCRRYCQQVGPNSTITQLGTAYQEGTTQAQMYYPHPFGEMRGAPTITQSAGDDFHVVNGGADVITTGVQSNEITAFAAKLGFTTGASFTLDEASGVEIFDTTNGYVRWDAEL